MKLVNHIALIFAFIGSGWVIFGLYCLLYTDPILEHTGKVIYIFFAFHCFPGMLLLAAGLAGGYITSRKVCPHCGESVKAIAILCRYCHKDFEIEIEPEDVIPSETEQDDIEVPDLLFTSELDPEFVVKGMIPWRKILERGFSERLAVMVAVMSIWKDRPLYALAHFLGIEERTLDRFFENARLKVKAGEIRVEDLQTRINPKYATAMETYIFDILEEDD